MEVWIHEFEYMLTRGKFKMTLYRYTFAIYFALQCRIYFVATYIFNSVETTLRDTRLFWKEYISVYIDKVFGLADKTKETHLVLSFLYGSQLNLESSSSVLSVAYIVCCDIFTSLYTTTLYITFTFISFTNKFTKWIYFFLE